MTITRKYELRRRAKRQAETRRRITEATVELHAEVGPERTEISEVAKRAGVQRVTVYRHFPEQRLLLEACRDHWIEKNPPPDLTQWRAIGDPRTRLRAALEELYRYFEANEPLLDHVLRDAEQLPPLREVVDDGFGAYLAEARRVLGTGWGARGGRARRLNAVLGLALRFDTWRALVREERLSNAAAAELMVTLVDRSRAG